PFTRSVPVLKIGGNGPKSDNFDACLVPRDEWSLSRFVGDGYYCNFALKVYNAPNMFLIRIHHSGNFQRYPGRMYVCGQDDIFDMVDIDLFIVVAMNMMVVQLVKVIDDVMRQLSFAETKLDGEAGFADVAGSGMDSSVLSHDESFRVDDVDLNLNEHVNLNVFQVETQYKLHVSEEPDVGKTQEPIVVEVSTQEPIVAECNGEFNESAPGDGQFFYDNEGIDTTYDVQSSEDAGTDDDDKDEDFLVDEENEIVDPDVDVHLFGISMDLPFDNISVINLVPDDVLEGDDVDVINMNGFDSDPEAKDRVYLHSIGSRRNLKLYKNDNVRIITKCDEKVPIFTMSQGTGLTGSNRGMEAGPSGSSDIPIKAVQDQLQRDLEVQISMSKAFRAKAKAEREIRGDHVLQYSMLRDYGVSENIHLLGALKLGFRACRRDLLGLDGAFMKGPFLGQVLVAVRLDLNNRIHPLAYALVEVESRAKSDLLLKNICEVFNGKIVGGRDKPVIILLDYTMEYCMKRIVNVQGVLDKCTGPLTPTITRIMESIKKEAHLMKVQWNGVNINTGYNKAKCKGQGGNITEASGGASKQAQQKEPVISQDGLAESGVFDNRKFMMVGKEDLIFKKISPMAEDPGKVTRFLLPKKVTNIVWYTNKIREQVEKLADGWGIVSYFVEKAVKEYADDE
nr:hypothetical protein [Tanacetum cinerariifolium]